MNYKEIYLNLVKTNKRVKNKDIIYELHHILPRSMGGSNEKTNLVLLTPKEHFLAHKLLVKIYPDSKEMKFALFMMAQEDILAARKVSVSSREYEKIRSDLIESRKKYAMIENSFVFDNNIKLSMTVVSKFRSKWRWSDSLKKAMQIVICNGITAYAQGLPVSYRRSSNSYTKLTGKAAAKTILKSIDILEELGYIRNSKHDSDVPVSEKKLSVYTLTDLGYTVFTTAGLKM